MNVFAHNSLKFEHETYKPPRSYTHTRVHPIRTSLFVLITRFQLHYEPPRS